MSPIDQHWERERERGFVLLSHWKSERGRDECREKEGERERGAYHQIMALEVALTVCVCLCVCIRSFIIDEGR